MSVATCEQITSELVAFLDGELSDADRRPVAAHLSTCLGCRREVERLGTVQRWLSDRPATPPSASFATDFWRRMNAEEAAVPTLRPRRRVWQLAVPALAAAAVLALVARSLVTSPSTTTPSAPAPAKQVAEAPARKAPAVVAKREAAAPAEPAQVADADNQLPEDLPPELVEHPELFLRLPVVRRLEKLEHFEEVRERTPAESGNAEGGAG